MATGTVEFHRVFKKFHRGELHDSLRDLIPALARRAVGRGPRSDQLAADEFEFVTTVGDGPDAEALAHDLRRALAGRLSLEARLAETMGDTHPCVAVAMRYGNPSTERAIASLRARCDPARGGTWSSASSPPATWQATNSWTRGRR